MPKFLQWPDKQRLEQIKTEFGSITGIPNISGSVYTTHVPIIEPKAYPTAYFNKNHTEQNKKPSYSTTVQGVVDSRGVFTDVCIGYPGSMSDKEILEKSALIQRFNSGYSKNTTIVGSSTYALLDWLFVPYTHQNQTPNQHSFNTQIGEAQQIAKDAFMRLKGRWAYLQKRIELKLQDMPVVLGACCVLHNICEINNEAMDDDLKFDLFD
ncbi:putative harbinger transposase-derived nuclease domain-containing protein [Helianthus annuus]|uniref:Harbinger transposase-derived nuclease domain-containing protein n=1 Tax=Helianthus annuus TaxID=4232 RepID=A0A9K3EJN9_HELAN|nr:putative harbinger transposase-derived nuclease domain-containing protein [Helianthus annuus]KAJ0482452.1 putative harbinger transposase-derived nuclease domain-containing protein [Helianthus annuus]KAJ0672150.1 putative harbinger transposase-derived nuclease domain-containing protein [Helianthus annuus]KAJ0850324.1 putative harbinger transposase-derived nuclease domain-containing protein [Helianthus annuus]KAJ0859383.1 putative harbinger transposase-derived nuclease domain-containing protei